jgi:pyruvate,orthophosphate dikinase
MPGMMDTILNIGLNDDTLLGLGGRPGNALEGFALDSYARVIEMFGRVVREVPAERFAQTAAAACARAGVASVHNLPSRSRRQLVTAYQSLIAATGDPFPADPNEQLRAAILAVFRSWNTPRAIAYRRTPGIPDDLGTAATVQAMVFGNLGETSGTGVAFTRDPNTGAPGLFGEFLANAQGEDVVAGTRTPHPPHEDGRRSPLVAVVYTPG